MSCLTQPDSLSEFDCFCMNVRPGIHVPLQLESRNCPWPLINCGPTQEDFLTQIAIVVCISMCKLSYTSDFGAYVLVRSIFYILYSIFYILYSIFYILYIYLYVICL